MKKVLIIIVLIMAIFQMVVLSTAITIGSTASDRSGYEGVFTFVNKGATANGTGTITSVEIWAHSALSNCEVATFFVVSGNNLSTRDTHTIGSVTAGSKQTFSGLSLDVQTGDYLGIYYNNGTIDLDTSGGDGMWFKSAQDLIPCTNQLFDSTSGYVLSLYGTGTTTEEEDNAIFFGMNF